MAAATASPTHLYDPWAKHHVHYSPDETIALLDLLAVDYLIDSHAPLPRENALLEDLWSVDLEFRQAKIRDEENVATAPKLKDQKDIFMELLAVDREIDEAKQQQSETSEPPTTALHDPYAPKEHRSIQLYTGTYAADNDGAKGISDEELLRANATMMHLLSVDQGVDDRKRWTKDVESDAYNMIGDLYEIDMEVNGAQRKALLIEDFLCLVDVDRIVDGKSKGSGSGRAENSTTGNGGKRSIFSVKEKYIAKIADKYHN